MKSLKFILFTLAAFLFTADLQAQCSASFTYSQQPNGSVIFTATGANSMFTNYYWSFGNGSSGTGTPVTAYYNAPGTYTACLYVVDTMSTCSDSSCVTITIGGSSNCVSSFNYICYPTSASLTASGTYTPSTTFTWLSNGNVVGTGANYMYAPGAGTYTICLAVLDTLNNCADTSCQTVVIGSSTTCQAGFYIYPDSAGPAHTYIGVNTSTGTNLIYNWTWGDGSSSTGPYPSHTYASAGNYVICLYITSNAITCSDSICMTAGILKGAAMYTVNFQAPASTKDITTQNFEVYPNPAGSQLTIKGTEGTMLQVQVVSLNGSVVKSFQTGTNQAMDISDLKNGFYMVKVIDEKGQTGVLKFIKE
ncbi:MAG: T9SS type A sorting domain-containing protein [Chitinophagaceae bacterium]|nr:T9SS type A sorting domain-containing protein [Chitinophagaceae bacterium]